MATLTTARNLNTLTKSQEVHAHLLSMANGLEPHSKLPTVQQMCRELKVSITTVTSVLAKLENQGVVSRKQGSGIYVAPRIRQKCVGLVCEPSYFGADSGPFWSQLVEAARSRALQSNESFRFYLAIPGGDGSVPVHSDLVEDICEQRVQGVLFIGDNKSALNWLEAQGVPAVAFAGRGNYRVEIDVAMLVRLAVDLLVEKGCRRPALLSSWKVGVQPAGDHFDSVEAQEFRRLLHGRGIECDERLVWETKAAGNWVSSIPVTVQAQGTQAVNYLFDGSRIPPDSIVCTDDMMTLGVLTALERLGLKPGRDLEVVSHANKGTSVLPVDDQKLTLIEVDPAEVVRSLFALLECRMEGHEPVEAEVLVPVRLQ